jgi:hypothetical protein
MVYYKLSNDKGDNMTRQEVYTDIESKAVSQLFFRRLLARLNEVDEAVSNEFFETELKEV